MRSMKNFKVIIEFERESFNGWDYTEHVEYKLQAMNEKSAANKAEKKFPKWYGTIKQVVVKKDETVSRNTETS